MEGKNRSLSPRLSIRPVSPCQVHKRAFTLVELLVVIGIIALLISILLPSLATAREAAQRVSCSAKIQHMLIAAQIHVADHKGFYPLVGVLPGLKPDKLDDIYSSKYSYTSFTFAGQIRMIAPITIALASEMSYGRAILVQSNNAIGAAETDDGGFIRNFLCPSQATSTSEFKIPPLLYTDSSDGIWYFQGQSYIFNEAVLGWGEQDIYKRYKGRATMIRQPSRTMFSTDGFGGSVSSRSTVSFTGTPMSTVYNIALTAPVTLADAFNGPQNGVAGDRANFDLHRHHGKINIGFFDGHVETRTINTRDLSTVFLLAP